MSEVVLDISAGAVTSVPQFRSFRGANAADGAAIKISRVVKRYTQTSARPILQDVSFDVAQGSFVSVIGRSGSGKSTLLRLIANLLDLSDGRIDLGFDPRTGAPHSVRYVFQSYGESLFPWMSVRANVDFGLRHATKSAHTVRDDRRDASYYLDLVGLGDAADKYPWELSGGMQQRVAIARALASSPGLLLMDEPFGAVDALSRAKLQDMILQLWRDLGLTIVLVTHDIDEAIYLSDRVLVLAADGNGIGADIDISLPRPRSQITTRELPQFNEYRRELFDLVVK